MNGTRMIIWAAAAVAAIGTATAAVTVAAADDGSGGATLTQDQVNQELTGRSSGSPGPVVSPSPPDRSPSDDSEAVTHTLSGEAGQLSVACDGPTARLKTWSPNLGYRVDEVGWGPADQVSVWLESDSSADVLMVVECEPSGPVLTEVPEPDDDHDDDDHDDDYDDDHSGPGHGGDGRG